MRNYEMIFIVRPDVADEDVQKLITQMESVVASAGGIGEHHGKNHYNRSS